MPTPLSKHKQLISRLPVQQQTVTTKETTWKPILELGFVPKSLRETSLKIFSEGKAKISREDVFGSKNIEELFLKTIYWGYPTKGRGKNIENVLRQFPELKIVMENCRNQNLNINQYIELVTEFEKIKGLGISTYSKLLYFLNVKINGNPCQILDARLIKTFYENRFSDFSSLRVINRQNAYIMYPLYVELINAKANELECRAENIELFLFNLDYYLSPEYKALLRPSLK